MFDAERSASFIVGSSVTERTVTGLAMNPEHGFTKFACPQITLLAGRGVEGDAHCGEADQHLGRRKAAPPPNLRQVHLFPMELIEELQRRGYAIEPGAIGENITTRGIALVDLPLATTLRFPSGAAVQLTGRRTPCRFVDRLGKGLMKALAGDGRWGERPIAGVLGVVTHGGEIRRGDTIRVEHPVGELQPLPGI